MINADRQSGSCEQPRTLAWLCLAGFIRLIGAAYLSGSVAWTQSNPVPFINQPSVPDAAAPGGQSFILTVNGTGFVQGSTVQWNGSALATTLVNGSQLTAVVPASDIVARGTATVTVVNPGTGAPSNPAPFEVTSPTRAIALDRVASFSLPTSPCGPGVDLNRDGKLDLVACDYVNSEVWVYLGNGDGTFQAGVPYGVGYDPGQVIARDFNNDGKLDLVVAAAGGPWVLLGNGDGTFQPAQSTGDNLYVWMVAGDFNRDGKLDLAISVPGGDEVAILLGSGNGTFQPPAYYPAPYNPRSIVSGDFNADGNLDLAVVAPYDSALGVMLGNGDGTFRNYVEYAAAQGVLTNDVQTADLNGDGALDLVAGASTGNVYSVLLGNGDGTFQNHVDYRTPDLWPSWLAIADFNGDGMLDVAFGGGDSSLAVGAALGTGTGTFQSPAYFSLGMGLRAFLIEPGDFASQGRAGLVAQNATGGSLLVQVPSILSPTLVSFGQVTVGGSSTQVPVSLTNSGRTAFRIGTPSLGGAASGNFAQSNNCAGTTLQPGASCAIEVTFKPRATGLFGATITVPDTAATTPQTVMLSGVGIP